MRTAMRHDLGKAKGEYRMPPATQKLASGTDLPLKVKGASGLLGSTPYHLFQIEALQNIRLYLANIGLWGVILADRRSA